MSRKLRHIKLQSNTNYEEPYAIFERPTNATFIPKETMETNEEKTSVRQESAIIHAQPRLVKNTKAKGQEKTACAVKTLEIQTVGCFT